MNSEIFLSALDKEVLEVDPKLLKRYSETVYLLFTSEADANNPFGESNGLVRGILQNDQGEWGHWSYDYKTDKKKWIVIVIPEGVEDLRETHAKEIEHERMRGKAYDRICETAITQGLAPNTSAFAKYVTTEMNAFETAYEYKDSLQ